MAVYYPRTRESLSAIYGIGTRKLEKYADAFLEIIREHCQTHQIPERQKPTPTAAPAPAPPANNGKR
jgi:hypothetical protein